MRSGRGASEITEGRDGPGSEAGERASGQSQGGREEAGGHDLAGRGLI